MSQAYTFTHTVGGDCCWFGQVTKSIPQPQDTLVILGLCDCLKLVTAKLKAGETAVCGQALFMDPATGELTITPAANCFYGIAKSNVTGGAAAIPLAVYVYGGFDVDMVTVAGGSVTPALEKEARGLGVFFEKRQG